MRKLLLGFLIILVISLTACEKEEEPIYEINYPEHILSLNNEMYQEGNYFYNLIEFINDDVSFRVFRLYNKGPYTKIIGSEQISGYAFQVITDKELTITYSCYDEKVFELKTVPNGTINISETLNNGFFDMECQSGSTIKVILKSDTEILLEDNFVYYRNLVPDNPNDFELYKKDSFSLYNYIIIPLIGLLLVLSSSYLYKKAYKKRINNSLKNNTSFKLLDYSTFVIIDVIIIIVLVIGMICLRYDSFESRTYNNVHISNSIAVSNTEFEDLVIDFDHLELQEVRVLESEGELITFAQLNTRHYIDIDYNLIKSDVLDVLCKDENVSVCGGEDSALRCKLYGPMPAIRLILSDGNNAIHLKINRGGDALSGTSVAYIEIYTDEGVYYYHYNSVGIEEQVKNIYDVVETAFYEFYSNQN